MYDTRNGVEEYVAMARGFDGTSHVERLKQMLPSGAALLELGMGPGVDLDMLARIFHVIGSDLSKAFLKRYANIRSGAELLCLDAVTIDTEMRFDAIYSNKVLHHLTPAQLQRSLIRQAEILRSGGVLLHGLWAGHEVETYQGLFSQQYSCGSFAALVPPVLELVECESYKEMSRGDSIRVLLRLKKEKN